MSPNTSAATTVSVAKAGEILGLTVWQVRELCEAGLLESEFAAPRRKVHVDSIYARLSIMRGIDSPDGAA